MYEYNSMSSYTVYLYMMGAHAYAWYTRVVYVLASTCTVGAPTATTSIYMYLYEKCTHVHKYQ